MFVLFVCLNVPMFECFSCLHVCTFGCLHVCLYLCVFVYLYVCLLQPKVADYYVIRNIESGKITGKYWKKHENNGEIRENNGGFLIGVSGVVL